MTKKSFNWRNVVKRVAILAVVAFSVFATSCDKKETDNKQIIAFSFATPPAEGVIDQKAKTVSVQVPESTDVTALVPTITVSENATVSPASGVAQDFTNPVIYTVTAEDGSTADYIVTVKKGSGGDGDGDDVKLIKSATIRYKVLDDAAEVIYFCFDDYGEKWRFEYFYDGGNHMIEYYDGKMYHYRRDIPYFPIDWTSDNLWTDIEASLEGLLFSNNLISKLEAEVVQGKITKTTETILGKPCVVYRYVPDMEYAIWNKTVSLRRLGVPNFGDLEAVSVREGCPPNAFTQTTNIDW